MNHRLPGSTVMLTEDRMRSLYIEPWQLVAGTHVIPTGGVAVNTLESHHHKFTMKKPSTVTIANVCGGSCLGMVASQRGYAWACPPQSRPVESRRQCYLHKTKHTALLGQNT